MNDRQEPDPQIAFLVGMGLSEGYYVRDAKSGEIIACHTSVRNMTIFLERALGHRPGEESEELPPSSVAKNIVARFAARKG